MLQRHVQLSLSANDELCAAWRSKPDGEGTTPSRDWLRSCWGLPVFSALLSGIDKASEVEARQGNESDLRKRWAETPTGRVYGFQSPRGFESYSPLLLGSQECSIHKCL